MNRQPTHRETFVAADLRCGHHLLVPCGTTVTWCTWCGAFRHVATTNNNERDL